MTIITVQMPSTTVVCPVDFSEFSASGATQNV